MLDSRELTTVLAALQYWQEEVAPHGPEVARPYLPDPAVSPLSVDEISALRHRLLSLAERLRFVLYDTAQQQLADIRLHESVDAALAARSSSSQQPAVLILPEVTSDR